MSPPAIHVRFRRPVPGFTLDVDLTLPGRGVTALFGPSGSGKTTLLRLLAGLERAPGGYSEVNGEVWQDDARRLFVPVHRRALGYVFQDAALFPHLSVAQNLAYGQKRRRPVTPSSQADHSAVIELLGLRPLLNRRPPTLSGGERQRVAIGRALLAGPRLLLMDEPLASLDHTRKREILPYLDRLHASLEIPVLYVTHSPDEVTRLADHLVLLDAGRVVIDGPLAATLSRLDLPGFATDDFGTVIEGNVLACDPAHRLLTLRFTGGDLRLIHEPAPLGRSLRVQVLARDVSLTLKPPSDTSILNILPARITAINLLADTGHVRVGLDVGGTAFTARITRYSHDHLALRPGMGVHIQIKAVSVLA